MTPNMKTKIRNEFLKEKHNQNKNILGKKQPNYSPKIRKKGKILIWKRTSWAEFLLKDTRAGYPAKTL